MVSGALESTDRSRKMPGITAEGLARLDQFNDGKPPRSLRQSSHGISKDQMSRCTRDDEQLRNVDEFMRNDLELISKQEE